MPKKKTRMQSIRRKRRNRNRHMNTKRKKKGGLKILKDVSSVLNNGRGIHIPSSFEFTHNTACSIVSGEERNLRHPNSVVVKCNPQSNRVLDTLESSYNTDTKSFTDIEVNLKMDDRETTSNILSYRGDVNNNMLHGDGELYLKTGCNFNGTFDNDNLVNGIVTYGPPRPAVEGELVVTPPITKSYPPALFDGKPVKKYIGPVKNGTPHAPAGEGVIIFSDGTVYKGKIFNGKIQSQSPVHPIHPIESSSSPRRRGSSSPPPKGSSAVQKVLAWNPDNLNPHRHPRKSSPKTELERILSEIEKNESGTISRTETDAKLIQLYRERDALLRRS